MIKNNLSTFIIILSLTACVSSKPKPEPVEIFTTNISDNGIKFFVYSLERSENSDDDSSSEGKGSGVRGSGGKGGGGGRGFGGKGGRTASSRSIDASARENLLFEQLNTRLRLKLAVTGYCRKGFIELDRNINKKFISIRGECQEGASESDRRKFENE